MPSFQAIQSCRICKSPELVSVLSLGNQYLTGVFPRGAQPDPTCGPLELVKCHGPGSCGLLQLRHSYLSEEIYGDNYGYRSSLNRSMVQHLQAKVESLKALVDFQAGDAVLDVGSNDGTLLGFYPEQLRRIGMDPSAGQFLQYYKPGIEVVTDFFSADCFQREFGSPQVRIVTSIAMFYDLEAPLDFVADIARILAPDGLWHFEQSYMPLMLRRNAYDTVCHEHLEYYGLRQIQWVLEHCGMKIIDVQLNDINGGSFAITAAHAASSRQANTAAIQDILREEDAAGLQGLEPYAEFRDRVFHHRDELSATIARLREGGARILGYGASTKGNVILQFCGLTPEILPAIAEVNAAKFGCRTPGTGIPIISEAEAHAQKPDYLLALPWHFRKNLLEREAAYLKSGGRMLFPLPAIEIVGA